MDMINTTQSTYYHYDEILNAAAPFSFETFTLLELTLYIIPAGGLGIFGVFSNTVNIIVFHRQGILSSSSLVNLTGLAVADLLSCAFTVVITVSLAISHFHEPSIFHSTSYYVSNVATRPLEFTPQCTCWITASMAFERVISVTFPFKVKIIFTPRRALSVVTSIFMGSVLFCSPMLFEVYLAPTINPETNETYYRDVPTGFTTQKVLEIYSYTTPVTLRILAIFIVVLCNMVIFWKVKLSRSFRKTTGPATSTKTKNPSHSIEIEKNKNRSESSNIASATINVKENQSKEKTLLRMMVTISIVYMVCYVVHVLYFILYYIVWEFEVDFHYFVDTVAWNFASFVQIINCSTNIIIYYCLSARFREEFNILFRRNI